MVRVIDTKLGIKPNVRPRPNTHRKVVFLYFCCANDRIWLAEHNVNLSKTYPNSEEINIQVTGVGNTITSLTRKPQCSAYNLFSYLGVPTAHAHNGGNDAAFELQAWVAGLCLTPSQRSALYGGAAIRPYLPSVWSAEFHWSTHTLPAVAQPAPAAVPPPITLPPMTAQSTPLLSGSAISP